MICQATTHFKNIIANCYKSDIAYLLHLKELQTISECIEMDFSAMNILKKFVFYKLLEGKNLVGYFGVELHESRHYLTGFFIKPEYRESESIKKQFWEYVKRKTCRRELLSGIFARNTRAKKFLEKNEFLLINTLTLPTGKVVLLFKREKLCQQQEQ